MTTGNKVRDVLAQHRNDEVMLDAFWQWASNPTSFSAGYAFKENYSLISGNLQRRYRLGASQADEAVTKLASECERLSQSTDIYDLQREIHSVLSGEQGVVLRNNTISMVNRANIATRCTVAIVNWLTAEHVEDYNLRRLFNEPAPILQSLLRAILDGIVGADVPPLQSLRDELITCGVLNVLFYRSSNKNNPTTRYEYHYGLIPDLELRDVMREHQSKNVSEYVSRLFERQLLEQARILEGIACWRTDNIPGVKAVKLGEEPIPAQGIIGTFRYTERYGERVMVAVNPIQRKRVLDDLAEIKKQRLSKTRETVTGILEALHVKEGSAVDLINLKDEPDRKVWLLELVRQPRLFISMGNWAIANDLSFLEDCGIDSNDSVLFIVVDQSLPSINRMIVETKAWKCQSITIMAVASKEVKVDQMQGQAHPLTSSILKLLESSQKVTPASVASSPIQRPIQVVRQSPSQEPQPDHELAGQIVLGDIVSKEELYPLVHQSGLIEDERRENLGSIGTFFYPLAAAKTHTAIFGMNGSGKSITTKRLVNGLIHHNVPVTIVDWHDEYADDIRSLGGIVAVPPTATVKPNKNEVPFTWNVLDPRFYSANVTPETTEDYIQIVVDLLGHRDVMALTPPMKGGLIEILRLAYQRKRVPTFKDTLDLVHEIPVPPATADALHRRLQQFSGGSLGSIFCTETSFDPSLIFDKAMDLKVNHLTVDNQSSVGLLTFFLLRQAISYFKRIGEAKEIRHVTIIEEAPMVIGTNPKVEKEVISMLQEVRKFGEGLVLVCRNPGIGDDILRETNQKIAHKLDVPRDVSSVASMLGLDAEDKKLLHSLPRGVAFARIAGNPTTLVRIKRA